VLKTASVLKVVKDADMHLLLCGYESSFVMATLPSRCGHYIFLLFMAALWNRAGHIFLPCGFFLLLLSFFSSPNFCGYRMDVVLARI